LIDDNLIGKVFEGRLNQRVHGSYGFIQIDETYGIDILFVHSHLDLHDIVI
jgi:hypothetical protein